MSDSIDAIEDIERSRKRRTTMMDLWEQSLNELDQNTHSEDASHILERCQMLAFSVFSVTHRETAFQFTQKLSNERIKEIGEVYNPGLKQWGLLALQLGLTVASAGAGIAPAVAPTLISSQSAAQAFNAASSGLSGGANVTGQASNLLGSWQGGKQSVVQNIIEGDKNERNDHEHSRQLKQQQLQTYAENKRRAEERRSETIKAMMQ